MGIISTQAFTFRLIANGQQLDLFEDEDIQLSNNVTGLFDLGVLPSDFTRQITLPGTKVNNAFFEHVYDISIDSPFLFATNVKVPAYFDFGDLNVKKHVWTKEPNYAAQVNYGVRSSESEWVSLKFLLQFGIK